MLNHAIDNLTTAQEDVFLGCKMIAFTRIDRDGSRCFLGALDAARLGGDDIETQFRAHFPTSTARAGVNMFGPCVTTNYDNAVAVRFNELCQKLQGVPVAQRVPQQFGGGAREGAARLGILIRDRIYENRARRVLQSVEATAHV